MVMCAVGYFQSFARCYAPRPALVPLFVSAAPHAFLRKLSLYFEHVPVDYHLGIFGSRSEVYDTYKEIFETLPVGVYKKY